jgi:hypothetical protein
LVQNDPDPRQEALSIEDTNGPEELMALEGPIALSTSTLATITTSSTSIPSSSSRSPLRVQEVSPYPYLYSHFNLGYLNPQISELNMVNRVNPVCLQDSEKEKETTHEEAQEVQDQEESFMDLGWSTVFEEVMEAKKERS